MVSKWEDYGGMNREQAVSTIGIPTVTTAEAPWEMLH